MSPEDDPMSPHPRQAFQHALTVRNVVARYVTAMEHTSPEAMKTYLHDHPDADPANHHVKKPEGGEKPGAGEKGKGEEKPGEGAVKPDPKKGKSSQKALDSAHKSQQTATRLKDQVARLCSYRHDDPAKAYEVSMKLHGEHAKAMDAAKEILKHGEELLKGGHGPRHMQGQIESLKKAIAKSGEISSHSKDKLERNKKDGGIGTEGAAKDLADDTAELLHEMGSINFHVGNHHEKQASGRSVSASFHRGQLIGRDDLTLHTLASASQDPVNAAEISYALYAVTASTESLIGPAKRTPVNPAIGEYYASVFVPPDAELGVYRIRWAFRESATTPIHQVVQEFGVTG